MIIRDKGVTLRAIEEEDLEILRTIANSEKIEKYLTGFSLPVSKIDQKNWFEAQKNSSVIRLIIEYGQETWGIVILNKIDYTNRSANFGIKTLLNENKPKGIGTEAGKIIIKYAFEVLNLRRVETEVLEYNIASKKMLEKIGFKYEGTKREAVYKNGKYENVEIRAILKGE